MKLLYFIGLLALCYVTFADELSTEGKKVLEKIHELKAQEKTQLDTLTTTEEKDKVEAAIDVKEAEQHDDEGHHEEKHDEGHDEHHEEGHEEENKEVSEGHDEGGKKEEHGDEHHVVKRAVRHIRKHGRKWWKQQQRLRRINRAKAKRNVWKRSGFKGLLGRAVANRRRAFRLAKIRALRRKQALNRRRRALQRRLRQQAARKAGILRKGLRAIQHKQRQLRNAIRAQKSAQAHHRRVIHQIGVQRRLAAHRFAVAQRRAAAAARRAAALRAKAARAKAAAAARAAQQKEAEKAKPAVEKITEEKSTEN